MALRIYNVAGAYAIATNFASSDGVNKFPSTAGVDVPQEIPLARARQMAQSRQIILNDPMSASNVPIVPIKDGKDVTDGRLEVGASQSNYAFSFSLKNGAATTQNALIGGSIAGLAEGAKYAPLAAASNIEGTSAASNVIGGSYGTSTLVAFRQQCVQPLRVKGFVSNNFVNGSTSTAGTAYTSGFITFLNLEPNGNLLTSQYDITQFIYPTDLNQAVKNIPTFEAYFTSNKSMVIAVPAGETVNFTLTIFSSALAAAYVLMN